MLYYHQYHPLKLKKLTHADQNSGLILRSVEQVPDCGLIKTGPTHTNLMDVGLIIRY